MRYEDLPPGNLRTVFHAMQEDLKAMSPAERRAYFNKNKVEAVLTVMGVSKDVMAGWDGNGDFPLERLPPEKIEAFKAQTESDAFRGPSPIESLLMAGIDDQEPPADAAGE
jgi:hypothetical protein